MSQLSLQATVTYQNIENGFWGLIGPDEEKYLPINFPEQLKYPNKQVEITLLIRDDIMSFMQWGTLVEIISFETLSP